MIAPRWVSAFLIACAAAAPFHSAPARRRAVAPRPAGIAPTVSAAQSAQPVAFPEPAHTLTVTVTDEKGRLISGLMPETFTITDGGQPTEIVSFAAGDMPVTVGILLDASASMFTRDAKPDRISDALLHFLRNCNRTDEFFLVAFNRSPQLLQGGTSDTSAILSALTKFAAARPKGLTALYDALYLATNQAERGRHQKRALLLISDGQDNISHYTLSDVRRQLKESDVTVYAVGVGLAADADAALGYQARSVLEELTSISGGRAFFTATPQDLYAALERIADELRNQYIIGIAPAPTVRKDGWHDLKLKLGEVRDASGKKIKTLLRAREGFYGAALPPK